MDLCVWIKTVQKVPLNVRIREQQVNYINALATAGQSRVHVVAIIHVKVIRNVVNVLITRPNVQIPAQQALHRHVIMEPGVLQPNVAAIIHVTVMELLAVNVLITRHPVQTVVILAN